MNASQNNGQDPLFTDYSKQDNNFVVYSKQDTSLVDYAEMYPSSQNLQGVPTVSTPVTSNEAEATCSKPNYFKKFLWGLFCIPAVPFRMAFETAVFPLKMLYDWGKTIVDTIKCVHKQRTEEKDWPWASFIAKSRMVDILFTKPIDYIHKLIASPFAYFKSAIENAVAWGKVVGTDGDVLTCNKYAREVKPGFIYDEARNEKGSRVEVKKINDNSFKYEEVTFVSIIKFLFGITTTNVVEKEGNAEAVGSLSYGKVMRKAGKVISETGFSLGKLRDGFIRPSDYDIVSLPPKQEGTSHMDISYEDSL